MSDDDNLVAKVGCLCTQVATYHHEQTVNVIKLLLAVAEVMTSTSSSLAVVLESHHFVSRSNAVFGQRLRWYDFVGRHGRQKYFERHIRMSLQSFHKLLSYVYFDLTVDEMQASRRGGAIVPEICLYCAIRYLAGGTYTDVFFFSGISKTAFYDVVWRAIRALLNVEELQIKFPQSVDECATAAAKFHSISDSEAISNCVAVFDGYHLETLTPRKKEVDNVRSFFSGHYQTYGINIQAAFDHLCRFIYLAIAGQGSMPDRDALSQCKLGEKIENLPGLYCAIGDCAYTPTEHCIPIFGGAQGLQRANFNFNFFASQLRIRAEMGFGLMREKFAILQSRLRCRMKTIRLLMPVIARLHNFCINERLLANRRPYQPNEAHGFNLYEEALRVAASQGQLLEAVSSEFPQWSFNRERMVSIVTAKQVQRPTQR